jgi:SAM-dependent methyltransferase
MPIRVTHVDLGQLHDGIVIGRNLEQPTAETVLDAPSVEVVGWVVGAADDVDEVVVNCDERFWRTVPLDQARPDLVIAFPDSPHASRAGFRARIGLRGMTRAEIGLHAKTRDGRYVHLATLGLERDGIADPPDEAEPVGRVDLGDLRRLMPLSREWGYDRGAPIDRYYIEAFLARQADDIHGRTLEIGDDTYSRRFGGDRVTEAHVLDIDPANAEATVIADLADASHVPSDHFDAIIATQTLHLIQDIGAAIATLHRILAPGGTLLVTTPGINPIGHREWRDRWSWGLTTSSATSLFETAFTRGSVHVESMGNVLAAAAFVYGLAQEDITPAELDVNDPCYPVTVAIRATKDAAPSDQARGPGFG